MLNYPVSRIWSPPVFPIKIKNGNTTQQKCWRSQNRYFLFTLSKWQVRIFWGCQFRRAALILVLCEAVEGGKSNMHKCKVTIASITREIKQMRGSKLNYVIIFCGPLRFCHSEKNRWLVFFKKIFPSTPARKFRTAKQLNFEPHSTDALIWTKGWLTCIGQAIPFSFLLWVMTTGNPPQNLNGLEGVCMYESE